MRSGSIRFIPDDVGHDDFQYRVYTAHSEKAKDDCSWVLCTATRFIHPHTLRQRHRTLDQLADHGVTHEDS
jgi:hypothetical protein